MEDINNDDIEKLVNKSNRGISDATKNLIFGLVISLLISVIAFLIWTYTFKCNPFLMIILILLNLIMAYSNSTLKLPVILAFPIVEFIVAAASKNYMPVLPAILTYIIFLLCFRYYFNRE